MVRITAALLIALGLSAAGWFTGQGFVQGRMAERYVTVKGVSERNVSADIALWPIRFVATSDDLGIARNEITQGREKILGFLQQQGIDAAAVQVRRLEVNDLLANAYRSGPAQSRYIITQTLMVRTGDPELVMHASQRVGELVDAGVVLTSNAGPDSGPTYLYTRLNDIKPQMIAESTASARQSAEQFASDSGTRLGGIRRANQGIFVILPRDRAPGIREGSQPAKTVRVVSTIDYFLED